MQTTLVTTLFLSSIAMGTCYADDKLNNNISCLPVCNPFSGATSVDVQLNKDPFNRIQEAVPYARLDISRALNPWYDIFMLQLELILPRGESIDKKLGRKQKE